MNTGRLKTQIGLKGLTLRTPLPENSPDYCAFLEEMPGMFIRKASFLLDVLSLVDIVAFFTMLIWILLNISRHFYSFSANRK